ncbi:MAG: helix-turn-helix domain-containing protein, partial [Rhodothermaceae bacterium]|nr:helix-turn-helix domain-containing protein [Rhodothermaceae bacterium]
MIVKSEVPDDRQENREDEKNVDSSRQWQSNPGKHGGRLLKGRSGAPGKKPDLTNPDSLVPSERNLDAESQIRDIQSALLLWQRDAARGRRLSDRAVMVYQFFITHCRRKPREESYLKCWHTVERIADRLCMGKRTVERAIAELKKASILLGERERYENGKFGPRHFWVLTPPDLTKYAPSTA